MPPTVTEQVQARPAVPHGAPPTFAVHGPVFAMKKSKDEKKEGPSLELILRWISPLNPYMWFVYFFVFIIGVDAVKHL